MGGWWGRKGKRERERMYLKETSWRSIRICSDILLSPLLSNALKGTLNSSPPAQPEPKLPDYLPPSKLIFCFLADLSQG